jgi:prepilin-type N-terminal cleavage/methylation domain-containing protein
MAWQKFRSGVTLLELMMVIAILSITAVGVIPLMSQGGYAQVHSAADSLAVDLNYARNLAITHAKVFTVRFYPGQETYQIEDAGGQVITHPVNKKAYQVAFPADRRLSEVDIVNASFDSTSLVRFDYQGSPYNGSGNPLNSGMVTLRADSETRFVAVEPVTGVISVQH